MPSRMYNRTIQISQMKGNNQIKSTLFTVFTANCTLVRLQIKPNYPELTMVVVCMCYAHPCGISYWKTSDTCSRFLNRGEKLRRRVGLECKHKSRLFVVTDILQRRVARIWSEARGTSRQDVECCDLWTFCGLQEVDLAPMFLQRQHTGPREVTPLG